MRDIYISYCKRKPEEIKKFWDSGLITFDANVLLNLYRYSEDTRNQILKLIEKVSSKVFLTYQAGLEFHRNRFEVISEQEKIYKEFSIELKNIEDELSSKKHPFLKESIQTKLTSVFGEVKSEISNSEKYYCDLIKTDLIYEGLFKIFDKKIEKNFSEERLKEIYEEGKKRYEAKIPPGYEDAKEKTNNKEYGDLILWKQIIEKAKQVKKPIILVTDDRKNDWWWKLKNGKTIGSRPELNEEIFKEAKIDFYLYSTEKFLEYGLPYVKEESNPKAVEEVKQTEELQKNETSSNNIIKKSFLPEDIKRDIAILRYEKLLVTSRITELSRRLLPTEKNKIELHELKKKESIIEHEIAYLEHLLE